jgi:hypothetical protein
MKITIENGDTFIVTAYMDDDGTSVIHIDTPTISENSFGPVCRIYLNDNPKPLYANPDLPEVD